MKSTSLLLLTIVFCASSFFACRSHKNAMSSSNPGIAAPKSVTFLQKKLAENAPKKVTRFSARAKMLADQDGQQISFTANIIWVKDSALWVNVKKFGFEAARALVTPDSVYVLDRLKKTVRVHSWAWLHQEFQLPGDFSLIENLVLGTAWFDPEMTLTADTLNGQFRLKGAHGKRAADYRIKNSDYLLEKMTFLEPSEQRDVIFDFDKFEKTPGAGGGMLPYLRRISANSPQSGDMQLEIELTDVEINVPKAYRFEIPSHYKRVE